MEPRKIKDHESISSNYFSLVVHHRLPIQHLVLLPAEGLLRNYSIHYCDEWCEDPRRILLLKEEKNERTKEDILPPLLLLTHSSLTMNCSMTKIVHKILEE